MSENRNRSYRIIPGAVGGASPLVEITDELDLPPGVNPARDLGQYDPNVVGDNSNIQFAGVAKDRRQIELFLRDFMRNAKGLKCPNCSGDQFRIFADDDDDQPLILLVCYSTRCGATWAPMKLQKPQLTDAAAKPLGLHVPS